MLFFALLQILAVFCENIEDTNALVFYVSPSGSDTNAGTVEAPFLTLKAAIEQINSQSKPAEVHFAAGDYLTSNINIDGLLLLIILNLFFFIFCMYIVFRFVSFLFLKVKILVLLLMLLVQFIMIPLQKPQSLQSPNPLLYHRGFIILLRETSQPCFL